MNAPALAAALPLFALPYFAQVPSPWAQACSGGGCYTNYAAMADLDGDGALDIILPNANGYFSQVPPAQPLVILLNDSSGNFADASATAVGGFTGYLRQVAIGDIDGDGDLDMYAPDAWGGDDAFFVNDGDGVFADEASTRLAEQSHAGAARFGDVDGDGDLDLVVSDWGTDAAGAGASTDAHLYLNGGTGIFTNADAQLPARTTVDGTVIDLDFFDADGDFDLDLLLDSHENSELLWINDGTGTFTDASASLPTGGGLSYGPVACDVDGDGDLDLAIDNSGGANKEQLFVNDGAGAFTDVSSSQLPSEMIDDNGLICADLDADGDFDLVIPSLGSTERVLANDGTGHFTALANAFEAVSDSTLGMDLGDVDGDGRLDAVTAQGEGGSFVDRLYAGTNDQPVDDDAPAFRAVQVDANVPPGDTLRIRFAVEDSHTTDIGPRLERAWLVYTIDAGAPVEVDADFAGGDLFQASSSPMPATGAGAYHVCATDWIGNSACSAPDISFSIAPGDDDDDDDDDDDGGGSGCGCHTAPGTRGAPSFALLALAAAATVFVVRKR